MAKGARQTSGDFLIEVIAARLAENPKLQMRHDLAVDVYIKQWSFAWLNRLCLGAALVLSVIVLLWPVLGPWVHQHVPDTDPTVMQTILTAAAAGSIYAYQHYKKRQVATENLLRSIVFGHQDERLLVQTVISEMSKIDTGFGFQAAGKDDEAAPQPEP